MKQYTLIVALAAVLSTFSTNTYARCTCYIPDDPEIPDGATAEPFKIVYTKRKLDAYQSEMASYKQCLQQCLVDAADRENKVVNEWNATVKTYNAKQQDN